MHAIAEILNYNSLKTISKLKRVILFNGAHVGVQKAIYFILKVVYMIIDLKYKN